MTSAVTRDPALEGVDAANHQRTVRALALAVAVVVAVLAVGVVAALRSGQGGNGFLGWFCFLLPIAVVVLFYGRRAEAHVVDVDGPIEDEQRARRSRQVSVGGIALAALLVAGLAIWASWDGLEDVGNTFFSWTHLSDSAGDVFDGFKLNVLIFVVAEVLVLAVGLLVASARELPGRAAAPLRWLAVAYVDLFRGLPALITVYLIVFGLPLTELPIIEDTSDIDFDFLGIGIDQVVVLAIIALTLVYGAYVAEVFRAGIESIHWSQRAAARGLGLSRGQSLRHVVLPQATRRVIPPLLNDFIGMQKDTALLGAVGVLEATNLARIYSGNNFNLSSITGAGICFLVITVPLTRFTDYLVRRDQARMQAALA